MTTTSLRSRWGIARYTGARLSLPPGALAPETVARVVVRLARPPRNTTVVGAPAVALKLAQFATPNLGAAMLNGFMDVWSSKANRGADTSGTLFDPPTVPSGPDGQRRKPHQRRVAATVAGIAAAVGLVSASKSIWQRSRMK